MTAQEMFDKVVAHARAQKCKAIDCNLIGNPCLYRGPNGTKCFIGALIPDDKYEPRMECIGLSHPDSAFIFEAAGIPDEQSIRSLAEQLQKTHDSYAVEEWEYKFKSIADDYDLTYTAP